MRRIGSDTGLFLAACALLAALPALSACSLLPKLPFGQTATTAPARSTTPSRTATSSVKPKKTATAAATPKKAATSTPSAKPAPVKTIPAAVPVPSVVGLDLEVAGKQLQAENLSYSVSWVSGTTTFRKVLRQNLPAGTRVARGSVIGLEVSLGR